MDYLETTEDEEAAKRFRQRKYDGFPAEVCAAAMLGAAAAVKVILDYAEPSSDRVEFARVAIVSMCGMVIFGAIARMVRTRNPFLVLLAAPFGMVFATVLVMSGPEASPIADPTVTATSTPVSVLTVSSLPRVSQTTVSASVDEDPPSTTEPLVASAGPVPPGDGTASSSSSTTWPEPAGASDSSVSTATETSLSTQEEGQEESPMGEAVSCTIDVQDTKIVPSAGCDGRVDVRVFGEPRSGPSAWQLPGSAELLMASLSPEDPWSRVGQEAGTAPGCVFDLDAANAEASTTEPTSATETTTSADRIRVIELRNAPTGTRITLWAECDPSKEQSFDPTAGWVIEVVQPSGQIAPPAG